MKTNTITSKLLLVAAISAALLARQRAPSSIADNVPLHMSPMEREHVLSAFRASATPTSNSTDTVWARRVYAPMLIHSTALCDYRAAIEEAFPEHAVTFDVVFAATENEVPWHTDYDSLGPFDASPAAIAREDFITVHTNLVSPEGSGGRLRTIDSLAVAALHYASNRVLNSFGSLAAITEPLATTLGARVRTHDGTPGAANAFNNLKAHDVTAGAGRVSYVVRLVRKSVLLSASRVREAAGGTARSTRRIREFEAFLPHLQGETVPVGEFPWGSVGGTAEGGARLMGL